MELMFNELSTIPLSPDVIAANEKMIRFSEVFARARQIGFRRIRTDLYANQIMLSDGYSLHDWLVNRQVPQRYRDILFGVLINPFINDDDEEIVEQYVMANYFFEDAELPIVRTPCLGLASANLYETASVSLQSAALWLKKNLPVIIETNGDEAIVQVKNVASAATFNDEDITVFVENLGEVNLQETLIPVNEKGIHLSDHHGKTELQQLCDQLKNSKYVIQMRSTGWGGKRFIRKINKDGTIEIVLYKTQRGYALWVQTSGRNYRETKAIANILEERYS
jgi:hypothetical protein